MTLSVHLGDTDPLGGFVWGADPATLQLIPKFWSKDRRGGYLAADILVLGAQAHLWDTLSWLRRPVEVIGEHGQEVWAGYVNEVEITTGSGVQFTVTLDGMANKVAVAYAYATASGGFDRGTSDWAQDDASVRRYGVKEYLHIMGEGESGDADTVRTKILTATAKPQLKRTLQGSGTIQAKLLCVGWAESLKWRKWKRESTRIEFEGLEAADDQSVGWAVTGSTNIAISRSNPSAVHDLAGYLGAALRPGNKITISGSGAGNNGTYTVYDAFDDDPVTYTAATVSFEGDNDIKDSAGGLGFTRKGAVIRVTGSANNSGAHIVSTSGDDHIEVNTLYGGIIAGETAGSSVIIQQGNEAYLQPRPTANEQPGASISVTLYGSMIAQRFTLSAAASIGQVAVMIGVEGAPLDGPRVHIYSDSAGSPGASLGSADVDASELATDPTWTWFKFAGAGISLSSGNYWIVVTRSGGSSQFHYYRLGTTKTANGDCKAHTGSTWVSNPTGVYIPHKVWSVEQTTTTINSIATTVGDLIDAVRIDANSGVYVNPEESGDRTAYDVIDKLIELGTSAGGRLFWEVTGDRTLRVYAEPTYDFNPLVLTSDKTLKYTGGATLERGNLPVGRFLNIEDVPEHLGLWPVLIDGAEYDADQGLQLYPKEEGSFAV